MTASKKFETSSFLPVIDQFIISLKDRISAYEKIDHQFGFLNNLFEIDATEIKRHADNLIKIYKDDLDKYLGNELIQFKEFCKLYLK